MKTLTLEEIAQLVANEKPLSPEDMQAVLNHYFSPTIQDNTRRVIRKPDGVLEIHAVLGPQDRD